MRNKSYIENYPDDVDQLISQMKKLNDMPCNTNGDFDSYSCRKGEEGIKILLSNNLKEGLKCFSEAINSDPNDYRHYLNRSYCYLRMDVPALALMDAEYVIEKCKVSQYLFIAHLRGGQAAFRLQKYKQAENYLKQAVDLNPENVHVQRELLRFKIKRITHIGYTEKDAILALEKHPTTLAALTYLSEKNFPFTGFQIENDFFISKKIYDDIIYSSDEDEKPNNFELVNKLLNKKQGKLETKPTTASLTTESQKISGSTESLDSNTQMHNIKNIWVGNLTNDITDAHLFATFSQFGQIRSIYRPIGTRYAFIHFIKAEDAYKVLLVNSLLIGDVMLLIKPARYAGT